LRVKKKKKKKVNQDEYSPLWPNVIFWNPADHLQKIL